MVPGRGRGSAFAPGTRGEAAGETPPIDRIGQHVNDANALQELDGGDWEPGTPRGTAGGDQSLTRETGMGDVGPAHAGPLPPLPREVREGPLKTRLAPPQKP